MQRGIQFSLFYEIIYNISTLLTKTSTFFGLFTKISTFPKTSITHDFAANTSSTIRDFVTKTIASFASLRRIIVQFARLRRKVTRFASLSRKPSTSRHRDNSIKRIGYLVFDANQWSMLVFATNAEMDIVFVAI